VVHPTVTENGEKAPALKFGQRGVMALFLARTLFQHLIDGFHNRDLRQLVQVHNQPNDLRSAALESARSIRRETALRNQPKSVNNVGNLCVFPPLPPLLGTPRVNR
jgi:hypothetical protein